MGFAGMTKKQRRLFKRVCAALALLVVVEILTHLMGFEALFGRTAGLALEFALFLVPYLIAGYDVLRKIQEECGADIYIQGKTLHVHAPGEKIGNTIYYDFTQNVQDCDLTYRRTEDRRVRVVVKALLPDGKVKEREYGTTGGDKVTVKCASSDDASMKLRGESEHKRLTFDGYDGNIVTWLIPYVKPGDKAVLHDKDYEYKDGSYYVRAVTTEFSSDGGKRTVELGYRLT